MSLICEKAGINVWIGKAREVNHNKAFWYAEQITKARIDFEVKSNRKPVIACMGLAFKPDIDDLRESPAKYITQKVMQSENNEDILIVDSNIAKHSIIKLFHYKEANEKADIVAFFSCTEGV